MALAWDNKIPEVTTQPATPSCTTPKPRFARVINERHGLGVPQYYRDIELLDCLFASITWICGILALVAIFNVRVAAFLGQTYQLIVVGFFLSIIAYCLQGRSTKFLIAVEILLGESSLQNLEAILQMDCSSSGASLVLRVFIVFLFALPLGLSVAYKSFTGGITVTTGTDRSMEFGMTPPPGANNTGYGLSLFSTTLLPYWSSPSIQTAYGFSLWSESADKVAVLDSPLEHHITTFQENLRPDQSAIIQAVVSAVQVDMVLEWNTTDKESLDKEQLLDYFGYPENATFATNSDLIDDYFNNCTLRVDNLYSGCRIAGLAYGPPNGYYYQTKNNTFFVTSRSDTFIESAYDTFAESSQGFIVSLKRYRGTWNVTRGTVTLSKAKPLPDAPLSDPRYDFDNVYKTVFQSTHYRFETYMTMLVEFDWKYPWARFDQVTCDVVGPPGYTSTITTDTALVASMVWSRVATKWGPTSAQYGQLGIDNTTKGDTKYSATVEVELHTQTLKRRWPLLIVILIMPTLTTLVVFLQWIPPLRGSPVSNGFGLISLLAAMDSRSLGLLRGAAYSGKLSRKVCAVFSTSEKGEGPDPSFQERSRPYGEEQAVFENKILGQASVSVALVPREEGLRGRNKGTRLRRSATYR